MTALARLITLVLIQIIISLLLNYIDRHNYKALLKSLNEKHVIIQCPKLFSLLGLLFSLTFIILFLLAIFSSHVMADTWDLIFLCVSALLGIIYAMYVQIWKIDVFKDEEFFLFRPLPFKTYKIKYEDCLWYEYTKYGVQIKTNKKTIKVNAFFTNYEALTSMLYKNKIKQIKDENKTGR